MADKSLIEWTEATWNPTTGCDKISVGCDNCYAATLAKRLKAMGNPKYQTDGDLRTSGPGFGMTYHAAGELRVLSSSIVCPTSGMRVFQSSLLCEFLTLWPKLHSILTNYLPSDHCDLCVWLISCSGRRMCG
jgi:protein gp37